MKLEQKDTPIRSVTGAALGPSFFLLVIFLVLGAESAPAKWPRGAHPFGQAVLESRGGSSVRGTVDFAKVADGLLVRVYADGLKPGKHGIHVHQVGDCSSSDGSSAGEHYNPTGQPHGGRRSAVRHRGDFGNVVADAHGNVQTSFFLPNPADGSDWKAILGKSIVVHGKRDDLKTDPAGGSGARVACGVIRSPQSLAE